MTSVSGLERTVLHPLYTEYMEVDGQGKLKGKLAEFGGHEMPLQFSHPFQEHLATRKTAALYDVSHMGNFKVKGKDALKFLRYLLTNDAKILDHQCLTGPKSMYSFLSDSEGYPIDDSILFKDGYDEFTLIVNAGNRRKDWIWINKILKENTSKFVDVQIEDVTKQIAMLSLQGPNSISILEQLLLRQEYEGPWPKPRRNYGFTFTIDGVPAEATFTGYTGEIGVEIRVPSEKAPKVWRDTMEVGRHYGILPAGLAARDSARAEKSLALYGMDIGNGMSSDPQHQIPKVPIYAVSQAKFAVDFSDEKRDFFGKESLQRQKKERESIERGQPLDLDSMTLKRMLRPLLVVQGGRKLHSGMILYYQGQEVGEVTSGMYAPYIEEESQKIKMRSIGVALINSNIRYNPGNEIIFQVAELKDERYTEGKIVGRQLRTVEGLEAKLVESNLEQVAHITVPQFGEVAKPIQVNRFRGTMEEFADALVADSVANEKTVWSDSRYIASQNFTSRLVRLLLTLDPGHTYNEHALIKALGIDLPYYQGTDFMNKGLRNGGLKAGIEHLYNAELREWTGAKNVEHRPISGAQANAIAVGAVMDDFNRYIISEPQRIKYVINVGLNDGGHISTQPRYGLRDFVSRDSIGRYAVVNAPMRRDSPYRIDVEATRRIFEKKDPTREGKGLIILGRSSGLYNEPVSEFRKMIDDYYGADNPNKAILVLDDAHDFGARKAEWNSTALLADLWDFSTHKVFFGHQRGGIATNRYHYDPLWMAVQDRIFVYLSNTHLHTMLANLLAAREMNEYGRQPSIWGKPYVEQVQANALALARAFIDLGLTVEGDPFDPFDPSRRPTENARVLLRVPERYKARKYTQILEDAGFITSPQASWNDLGFYGSSLVRFGVAAETRRGKKEHDIGIEAELISRVLKGEDPAIIAKLLASYNSKFQMLHYCMPPQVSRPLEEKIYKALRG